MVNPWNIVIDRANILFVDFGVNNVPNVANKEWVNVSYENLMEKFSSIGKYNKNNQKCRNGGWCAN